MINRPHILFKLSHSIPYSRLFVSFLILLIHTAPLPATPYAQEVKYSQPDLALEVILPNDSQPPVRLVVSRGGRGMTLIHRQRLAI